ncbi:MAG: DUF3122 domain-containing protein [Spirulinaceae cyanobacterium]
MVGFENSQFFKYSDLRSLNYYSRSIEMFSQIQHKFHLLLFFLTVLIFSGIVAQPAIAVLRQHQDSPGIMRYHVQHSIRAGSGTTWQVILFPNYKLAHPEQYYLRLVGFPGLAEFKHPQPLEIITAKGKLLPAADAFPEFAPAPNVGQFKVTDILSQLPENQPLTLSISLVLL